MRKAALRRDSELDFRFFENENYMNDYTIVLAHGIARFDFLVQRFAKDLSQFGINFAPAANELNYFKGVARFLRDHGFNVYQSSVSFAAGVERRAADLKSEVETALSLRPEQSKVHIIAHSMGGLDARQMIVKYGMAEKVASLTTIGTPHLGTSLADWGIKNEGHEIIKLLGGIIDLGGFADLTPAECRTFNEFAQATEAANEVVYQTYASSEQQTKIFAPLQISWQIIHDSEGENDGLGPLTSQLWTDTLAGAVGIRKTVSQHDFPVSADHLNEIGWWDLNQLQLSDILHGNLLKVSGNYERAIKDVYLEIASNVRTI